MSPVVGLGTGPGTQGWSLWISSVVMVIVAGLFVAARMAQRIYKKSVGLDDWVLIASLLSSVVLSITEIEAVVNGYGRHYAELSKPQAVQARKWFYGAQIAYKVVLALNKTSICYMYFRIFKVSSKAFRMTCYVVMVFIITSGLAFIIGTVFQCRPIQGFWDKTITSVCFSQTPWWLSYAILQILLDAVLIALPIKEVLKLQMSNLEKFGLILVFCTGLFVTFTSIFRATTLAASATDPDPTWGPIPATTWAVIEANSGIIAACLPLFRQPFLWLFRHSPLGTSRSTHRSGPGYNNYEDGRSGPRHNAPIERSTVEIRPTSTRESQEHIMKKNNDIYVLSDVSVTSTTRNLDDKDLEEYGRPFS